MNKDEKKALISFLLIYVSSTVLFIGIMLYSYYTNEVKNLDKQCNMIMSTAASKIKTDILKSHMDHIAYVPSKVKNRSINYGLFDKNQNIIFSNLESNEIDFTKIVHYNGEYNFHISTFEDKYENKINIKYIVIETQQGYSDKWNLKILTLSILIFSAVFILIIGYFLSKLLLKPVREKILHMDNFIKDSAHELNTPIAVLLTSASTLKQGRNTEKMLQYMISSAKQISHIYNDIHFSAFNEIDEDLNQDFDLSLMIKESVGYFNDIAITKLIIIEVEAYETIIFMDKNKTQRIINNLLSNAIKYSKKDSKILVKLKKNILTVEDFGIGISKEDQKSIFKRYKRGNNIEGGFGIGLDIVCKVIHEYNLSLNLESKPKVGSTFIVDFSNAKQINNEYKTKI